MIDQPAWARTEKMLRAAFGSGDLAELAPVLAPDVRWHGSGPGGCRSAPQVLEFLRAAARDGRRYRLQELRRVGPHVLIRVAVEPDGGETSQVATLDADGRITHLLDYPDPDAAAADLGDLAGMAAPSDAAVSGLGPSDDGPGAAAVTRAVPFVQVRDVEASAGFYRLLGFTVTGEYRPRGRAVFAALRGGTAELMLTETEDPPDSDRQGVLFYLYSDDLPALRRRLRAHGAAPSQIADGSPGPRQEMRLDDPDGYTLMIAQTDR